MRKTLLAIALTTVLAGCSDLPLIGSNVNGALPAQGPIVPDSTVQLTPSVGIALEKLVFWGMYAGAAYLILDPLAPNWEIEQASFPDQHYHLALKMKRYGAGGAGEARQVFQQRAKELMRKNGFDSFEIVEYSEGMESSFLGAQRVGRGVIRLTRADNR